MRTLSPSCEYYECTGQEVRIPRLLTATACAGNWATLPAAQ